MRLNDENETLTGDKAMTEKLHGIQTLEAASIGDWRVTIEEISPEDAQKYIETMGRNRTVRSKKTNKYSQDMNNGKWELTHQGIAFDKNGRLIDGQHRMLAVIKSGTHQLFIVFRGVEKDLFHLLDQGSARTTKDVAPKKYHSAIASTVRFVIFGHRRVDRAVNHPILRDVHIAHFASENSFLLEKYAKYGRSRELKNIYNSGMLSAFVMAALLFGEEKITHMFKRFSEFELGGKKVYLSGDTEDIRLLTFPREGFNDFEGSCIFRQNLINRLIALDL
mgnify:CR=1 FL=1